MKRLILGSTALAMLLTAAPVWAQMAPAPAAQGTLYNWTGFYGGANLGGMSGSAPVKTTVIEGTGSFFTSQSVNQINNDGSQTINDNALILGIQGGYNFQIGNWVLGAETDFNSFDTNATSSTTVVKQCCAPSTQTLTSKVMTDWLYTLRPRVGWAQENWLFYVTGGLALTQIHTIFDFSDTNAAGAERAKKTEARVGWTAGGGIEWGLSRRWTLKAEYLHVDFDAVNSSGVPTFLIGGVRTSVPANTFSHKANLTEDIGRVGLNFRF